MFASPRRRRGLRPLMALLLGLTPSLHAADLGPVVNEWSPQLDLPDPQHAASAAQVLETARRHLVRRAAPDPRPPPGLRAWSEDYAAVIRRFPKLTPPRPVLTEDGEVSRFLCGLDLGDGRVGGFLAVSADGAQVVGELSWDADGVPLWTVPAEAWRAASSVNEVPQLAELVTPYDSFTPGIPIEPDQVPGVRFVPGAVDDLPYKVQEERREWVAHVNATRNPVRPLKTHLGRRTATSKCMSVAASYLADWWSVEVGRELGTYVNGAGGQREYGFDPRMLEAIFYTRARREGGLGTWAFQTVPFGKDRVTGEPIPFSMRSFARILVDTDTLALPDPLVPSKVHRLAPGGFAMDDAPVFLYKRARWSEAQIAQAIETWGPLLGQHTSRTKSGGPKPLIGIHGVALVGAGQLPDGREVIAYKESFGGFGAGYLEDSFGGPRLRALPSKYLYQAIAFPHRLGLAVTARTGDDGVAEVEVRVTTNRGADRVDPHLWQVQLDGQPLDVTPEKVATGAYRLTVQLDDDTPTGQLTLVASRRYFADREGNAAFAASLPISRGLRSRSDDPANELTAPDPREAAADLADEVAADLVERIAAGDEGGAAQRAAEVLRRVPGLRRPLTEAVWGLYGGQPGQVPGALRAALAG